jgi:hypothetical protein
MAGGVSRRSRTRVVDAMARWKRSTVSPRRVSGQSRRWVRKTITL